ncbi:AI-2E family transporter [Candidatus Galacturonibacter soehngenii]|uniref:AI-2E family transporter n=1 Tax=Candidatus Galacturonatibacter soehngenii TaxID=2307010 RepID=A0A7V7UFL6_9FIRM|nr:AI-2E family transporter [Candidatus Galacturonibacter soehngenii]KAB1437606.1 AI-2E family transporter [Candidatus Galacturonibacter soehngenii]MBA4686832.1 AI-2E family transporter [Candidatus Galacturonibacter soehngenii]
MKFDKEDKLFKYAVYATLTAIAIYIAISIMGNIGFIIGKVAKVAGVIMTLLKPLIIALVIAYLFQPATNKIEKFLERKKILKKQDSRRSFSITIVYLTIIGLVIAMICGIYIMIGGQISKNTTISNIIIYITDYLNQNQFSAAAIESKLNSLNIQLPENFNNIVANVVTFVQDYITTSISNLAGSVVAFGSNILSFFISIILSIYLLKDYEYFKELWKKIFYFIFRKGKTGKTINGCAAVINNTFSNYIRGQLLDACIVGILSAIALAIIGIDYAIVIGIISGICNMIPYVGPLVGTVLAAIMGLLSGQPIMILWAIIAMIIVQQIDNNLIAPKIVGDSVGLHPVFTMLAILIGGNVGGLIGMLIAVPLTASIKILVSDWYNKNVDYNK